MPMELAQTAASGILVPGDRDRVYEVIRYLHDEWKAGEHIVLGEATHYIVEFKKFRKMSLDIKESVAQAMGNLPYVFDMQFHWDIPDPVTNNAVTHTLDSPCVLRAQVFVAKTGCAHPPADTTAELMTKFKDKIAVRAFLEGFLDDRDPSRAESWERVQEQVYSIVQMAWRRKEHLPWSFFDFSTYPTRKMCGFHIKNVDTTHYSFLRALSAVSGACYLLISTRTNEIEVILDGRDPIPWKTLPGSSPVQGAPRKRTSGEADKARGLDDPTHDDRHQKRARPQYYFP